MTLNLGMQYALTALISCSVLGLSLVSPVMAEDDSQKVKIVINVLGSANAEVQTKMLELQERGIDIPLAAKGYHAQALMVYRDAERALESGDAVTAKIRAMKAMELFKKATDELRGDDQRQDETAIVIAIEERIARLNHKADNLNTLATSNHESINFSNYASAINSAREALKDGSLDQAKEQLASAESILADIRSDIQDAADSKKDKRAKEFAQRLVTRLSDMISKAQEHDRFTNSTSSVQQISMFIEKLRNATAADEIMNMTDDLGELQSMIKEYGRGDNNGSADSDVKEDDDKTVDSGSGGSDSGSGSGSSGSGSGSGSGGSGSGSDNDDDDDREKDDEEEDDD